MTSTIPQHNEEAREIVESAEAFLKRVKSALEMISDEEKGS
ncbi:hypothetical protein [Thermococcus barophilus]|uniref:Uncharacterized protein n=1 Tax=Thermococcus barophilus TaxID=55802 RepID=A0A0S1X8X0_THEBA|nr:hypothetical protein [Thermococcus barophilus]ALM74243.1 hypothetical protein TBCH5v1_0265 [Thermococcus barophilus]